MNCLECATDITTTGPAQAAIGCCAFCGAGMCLDHARYVALPRRPIGVVAGLSPGRRRFVCTTCDLEADSGALAVQQIRPRRPWATP